MADANPDGPVNGVPGSAPPAPGEEGNPIPVPGSGVPRIPAEPARAAEPAEPAEPAEAAEPAEPAEPADERAPPEWSAVVAALPEALQGIASRYTTAADMAQAVADMRKQVSSRIKVPGADATPDEVAQYQKALGVPGDLNGYDFFSKAPEGFEPGEVDVELVKRLAPIAHKYNIPKAALEEFSGEFFSDVQGLQEDVKRGIVNARQELLVGLHKDWGADFDRNKNMSVQALDTFGDDELKNLMDETRLQDGGMLGDHPVMVKFFARLGARTSEGDLVLRGDEETRTSAAEELRQILEEHPPGSDGYLRTNIQSRVRELNEALYGGSNSQVGQL